MATSKKYARGVIPNLPPGLLKKMNQRRQKQLETATSTSRSSGTGRRTSYHKARLGIAAAYKAMEERLFHQHSSSPSPTTESSDYVPYYSKPRKSKRKKRTKKRRHQQVRAALEKPLEKEEEGTIYQTFMKHFKGCTQRYKAYEYKALPMKSSPDACTEFMHRHFSLAMSMGRANAAYTSLLHRMEEKKEVWEALIVTFDPSANGKDKVRLYQTKPRHRPYHNHPKRKDAATLREELFQSAHWGLKSQFVFLDLFHKTTEVSPAPLLPRKVTYGAACTGCRAAKKRCDLRQPSCGACNKKGRDCVYRDRGGLTRKRSRSTKQRTDDESLDPPESTRPAKSQKTLAQKKLSNKRPFQALNTATVSRRIRNSQHLNQEGRSHDTTQAVDPCKTPRDTLTTNKKKKKRKTPLALCAKGAAFINIKRESSFNGTACQSPVRTGPRRPSGGLVYCQESLSAQCSRLSPPPKAGAMTRGNNETIEGKRQITNPKEEHRNENNFDIQQGQVSRTAYECYQPTLKTKEQYFKCNTILTQSITCPSSNNYELDFQKKSLCCPLLKNKTNVITKSEMHGAFPFECLLENHYPCAFNNHQKSLKTYKSNGKEDN